MTSELLGRIDGWIATQPGYVSRQEAIRRLVGLALDAGRQDGSPLPSGMTHLPGSLNRTPSEMSDLGVDGDEMPEAAPRAIP